MGQPAQCRPLDDADGTGSGHRQYSTINDGRSTDTPRRQGGGGSANVCGQPGQIDHRQRERRPSRAASTANRGRSTNVDAPTRTAARRQRAQARWV